MTADPEIERTAEWLVSHGVKWGHISSIKEEFDAAAALLRRLDAELRDARQWADTLQTKYAALTRATGA